MLQIVIHSLSFELRIDAANSPSGANTGGTWMCVHYWGQCLVMGVFTFYTCKLKHGHNGLTAYIDRLGVETALFLK